MKQWFFLRGLVREQGHWGSFVQSFQKKFPQDKLFFLDIPGNGSRFQEKSPLSVPAMVESLRLEFLQKKTEAPAYLFCLSLGAMVGTEWLTRYQDFSGAIFLNTSMRGISPLYHRLRPSSYGTILGLFAEPDLLERERVILALTSNSRGQDLKLAQEWAELQRLHPVSKPNALRQLFAASRFSAPAMAPHKNILLLAGEQDRLVNAQCSKSLASAWNIPLKIHPSAGHDLSLDAADWVLEQVEFFLTKERSV